MPLRSIHSIAVVEELAKHISKPGKHLAIFAFGSVGLSKLCLVPIGERVLLLP